VATGVSSKFRETIRKAYPDYLKWDVQFLDTDLETFLSEQNLSACYLTADTDQSLEDVGSKDTLIIGGLVDRNRHKV